MADQARKQTDEILAQMEKKVSNIYKRASNEISEKWDKYMKSHEPKVKSAYEALQEALKSGDRDAIKSAREVYERTVKNVTLNDSKFRAMVDETTSRIAHVNGVALNYVSDEMPKIYTINYNDLGNQEIAGYSFTLVNEQAVRNLIKEDKSLLPPKKLDIPKDKAWNTKSINAEILQGILQGENISKIAKRLQNVTDMNRKSAIRNARTMTTGAENKGKNDSFKKATNDGVILKRVWIAAKDGRTRDWHAALDGQETNVDEAWVNDYGEIMYPGDPGADPANVYNCRCAIAAEVKGFAWNQTKNDDSLDENGLTLKERGEIMSYKSFDFYEINNILREEGLSGLNERQREKVDILDSALSKLPTYSGNVSRSLYFSDENRLNDYIQGVQASGKLDSPAYLSTTKNTEELYNPEGQVQIYIDDSKRGRDLRNYDNGENEVLYERNAKIDIIEQGWKDGVYIIKAKERK